MSDIFYIDNEYVGCRIDKVLSEMYPDKSRSIIQKYIADGDVTVNDAIVKSNYKFKTDDKIQIIEPEPVDVEIQPENIPLDILYEDSDVLIVNKPKGMVVHPAPGHYTGTLVNAIMYHCKDELSGINGEIRPGIVHRIDMDTTGALIICKNDSAHNKIAEQIKIHSINRIYKGIVIGNVKEDEGTIHTTIGRSPKDRKKMAIDVKNGREAITHYKVIKRFDRYTYMEFKLETGRTHQIRVHMASIGHPLLGDQVYGPNKCQFNLQGQTLHAEVIGFVHPSTGEYVEFKAPLPDYFQHLLDIL
ncbi:MAG: RluA family pseudouridine synthase [Lachnospiraceae bacterium]|nr:RluA family pseudouridine synthase [Lachnospiraceae bacterium]